MGHPRFMFRSGTASAADGVPATVSWRLMSGNNRELGRDPGSFPDAESCRAAVRRLVEGLPAATPTIASARDHAAAWTWRLDIDGRAVAVAGRSYLRYRECKYNLAHFLAAAAEALPAADLCPGGRR